MAILKVEYPVTGMTCAACASSVESILGSNPKVHSATVNLAANAVMIEMEEDLPPKELHNSLRAIGYGLILKKENLEESEARFEEGLGKLRKRLIFSGSLALPVMILSMFVGPFPFKHEILMIMTLGVMVVGGHSFFTGAFRQLRHLSFNMDSLIAMGTGSAFIFSAFNTLFPTYLLDRGIQPHIFFESAAVIIAMVLLGKYLEEKAKHSATSAIRKLAGLQPSKAIIIFNGFEQEVNISDIRPGDQVKVSTGDRIPVDGKIIQGDLLVDESMITGEPIPVQKSVGETLIAGTIGKNGAGILEATAVGGDTMLSRIIEMVRAAQGTKAPVQKLADQISAVFVPGVMIIALITGLLWYFLGPEPILANAIVSAVAVLVIACPCALGLATPTAIVVGIGRGAQEGLLIRDAESLERLKNTDVLIVDKTGTLTKGQPEVTSFHWTEVPSPEEKEVWLQMEKASGHPLGEAVSDWLSKEGSSGIRIEKVEILPGKGVKAEFNGQEYFVGKLDWMQENLISLGEDLMEELEKLRQKGESLVVFAKGNMGMGMVGISDPIRPEAKGTIGRAKRLGMEVVMLSGDHQRSVDRVSAAMGIDHAKGDCLPGDKLKVVEEYQGLGKTVTMLGDGINDSPALAKADIGIALASGTDIAMDSAGLVLVKGGIANIIKAINLSVATVRTLRMNLFFAFIYNVIGIPIAAGVLFPLIAYKMDPMLAGAAMALSSVSVVTNSLLLRYRSV